MMNTIAIDFGGTTIKIALFQSGRIIKRRSIPAWSERGLLPRLSDTREAAYALLDGSDIREYKGVAVAMPGIVDNERMTVTGIYQKYEDSKGYDLQSWCREAFGLPMRMGMDSKMALLGEMHYGSARGYKDASMLILGTGVGTAVAINGKILESRNHVAGALSSHIIIEMNGRKCTCPGAGCLEAMASGWALEGIVRDHPGFLESGLFTEETIDFRTLAKWTEKKDPVACDVLDGCVKAWRTGILNMIHAYDSQVVILSGAIMNFPGLFERLSEDIQPYVWDCCGEVHVKRAEHPEDSVLYGLYALMNEELQG